MKNKPTGLLAIFRDTSSEWVDYFSSVESAGFIKNTRTFYQYLTDVSSCRNTAVAATIEITGDSVCVTHNLLDTDEEIFLNIYSVMEREIRNDIPQYNCSISTDSEESTHYIQDWVGDYNRYIYTIHITPDGAQVLDLMDEKLRKYQDDAFEHKREKMEYEDAVLENRSLTDQNAEHKLGLRDLICAFPI